MPALPFLPESGFQRRRLGERLLGLTTTETAQNTCQGHDRCTQPGFCVKTGCLRCCLEPTLAYTSSQHLPRKKPTNLKPIPTTQTQKPFRQHHRKRLCRGVVLEGGTKSPIPLIKKYEICKIMLSLVGSQSDLKSVGEHKSLQQLQEPPPKS